MPEPAHGSSSRRRGYREADVGFALLEEAVLLETTPLASTPTTVNV